MCTLCVVCGSDHGDGSRLSLVWGPASRPCSLRSSSPYLRARRPQMKALFSRFKSSNGSVPQRDREMPPLGTALPPWPPPTLKPAAPPAMSEVKALPPITIDIGIHSTPASPTAKTSQHVQQSTSSTTATAVSSESANASSSTSPQLKKAVTFVSPPQSSTGLESSGPHSPIAATDPKRGNASFDVAAHSGHRSASNGRTSSSAGPLGSKASLATSARAHSTSLRPATTSPSLRSGSPYSQTSTRTAVPMVQSWSEGAEGDLVANLGQRERTRQEVLWEIVASEERSVRFAAYTNYSSLTYLFHVVMSSSLSSSRKSSSSLCCTPTMLSHPPPARQTQIWITLVATRPPVSPNRTTTCPSPPDSSRRALRALATPPETRHSRTTSEQRLL